MSKQEQLRALTEEEREALTPERVADAMSKMVMDGEQLAALTGTFASRCAEGLTWPALLQAQREQFLTVVEGNDLKPVEGMLLAQAVTLNAIFADLAGRAALNIGTYPEVVERYMRLALKAQSQSRATLETLAEVKNPLRFAYVRQANIANGPQQVNNGEATRAESRMPPNELVGEVNVLDIGAQAKSLGVDARAEAVVAFDRSTHARGKVKIKPQRVEGRSTAGIARAC